MMQNCRTHVRARQARIGHHKARWVVSTLALLVVPRLLQLRSCHQEQSWETGTKSQLRSKMLQDLQNKSAKRSGPHRPRKGLVGCKYCRVPCSAKITKSKLQCKMVQNCRTNVRARQARIGHDKARWVVSTLALLVVPRLLQLRSCHQEQSWETGTKSQLRNKMLQVLSHFCQDHQKQTSMQDDANLQNTCASASGPHRPRQGQGVVSTLALLVVPRLLQPRSCHQEQSWETGTK